MTLFPPALFPEAPVTTAPANSRLRIGIACLIGATLIFSIQDALTKHLASLYPIPFILMVRFWAFALMTIFIAAKSQIGLIGAIKSKRPWIQVIRGTLLISEIFAVAASFRTMPMADMQAIFSVYPLLIMVMAVFILKERIRWQQWLATFFGFVGLLVIVRPGTMEIHAGLIWVLVSAVLYAFYNVLTRLVGLIDNAATTFLYTGVIGCLLSSAAGSVYWTPMPPADWMWLIMLTLCGILGHFLIIKSLEFAPASVLQPFNYLQLIWETALGYMIFNAVPDHWTIIGGVIVGLSGLYALSRTRKANG